MKIDFFFLRKGALKGLEKKKHCRAEDHRGQKAFFACGKRGDIMGKER